MNLPTLAEQYKEAVETMEIRWATLKGSRNRYEPRLMTRFIRDMRRCKRLRAELANLMETGKL